MLSIGVDIGGTKVAAGVVDENGKILEKLLRPTPSRDPVAVEDAVVEVCHQFSTSYKIGALGVGVAGWVDAECSTIRFSPHLAWRDEPFKERLSNRLQIPVLVDNDANAAAWAEYRFGAGKDTNIMLMVNLGTGIGGALVRDGKVFRGAYGMAGEFGHMTVVPDGYWCPCGNRGCWGQYASGNALTRDAKALLEKRGPVAQGLIRQVGSDFNSLTGRDVTQAALDGDRACEELIADIGNWLGKGLANLAAAFDPELFIIGGGVSEAGEMLVAPARQSFGRNLTGRGHRTEAIIVLAQMRNEAGLVGAADLARETIKTSRGKGLKKLAVKLGRRRRGDRV